MSNKAHKILAYCVSWSLLSALKLYFLTVRIIVSVVEASDVSFNEKKFMNYTSHKFRKSLGIKISFKMRSCYSSTFGYDVSYLLQF